MHYYYKAMDILQKSQMDLYREGPFVARLSRPSSHYLQQPTHITPSF